MKVYEIIYRLRGQTQASFLRSMQGASEQIRNLYDQIQRGQQQGRNAGNVFNEIKRQISGTVASIGAGALAISSFKKALDFEQQISSIQAVSGLTKAQMGEIEQLALDMGAKTKYSALEAAQGIEELVKAGLSIDKIRGGGIEAALNLAAAGNLELADAAEIMSTAMNAFKSDGMEAAHAADILAGTANVSATNVQDLKFALSQASAVASGVGMSFDDTNAALGLFANNGLKGSDAGTSLKTMLLNLTPVTADAIGEFERLGLMIFDATKALQFLQSQGVKPASAATKDIVDAMMTFSAKTANAKVGTDKANKAFRDMAFNAGAMSSEFYDTNGSLKDLEDIAGSLKKALSGLTDAQRQVALKTMFGTDAVRASNILYKEGAEGVEKFYNEASKVTALDVAKTRLDNTKGSVELFKSAMETLQITAMKTLSPSLKKVADLGAEIATKHGKAVSVLGGIALAAYPITKVTRGVIGLTRAIGGAGVALRLLTGPVGWTIAAATAVAGGIYMISTKSKSAADRLVEMGEKAKTALGNYQEIDNHTKRMDHLVSEYDRLKTKISDAKTPTDELTEARRKLKIVEEDLIALNPDILKAEDAKTGKFREQLEMIQEQDKIKREMAVRELKSTTAEFNSTIYDSKSEYIQKMQDKEGLQKDFNKEYEIDTQLSNLHSIYKETMGRKSRKEITQEEANKIFDDLKNKAEKLTGNKIGGWLGGGSTAEIGDWAKEAHEEFNKTSERLKETEEKIQSLSESIKTAYEKTKTLAEIESGLGMPIDEAAKKYDKLTSEQKVKFDEVIRKLQEFKDKLDGLPEQKTIDLNYYYRQMGQIPPDIQPPSSRDVPTISQQPGGLKVQPYADGGIATRPHLGLTAEKGPEAMIPLAANKRTRALSLYDQVGKALGVRDYSSGGLRAKLQGSDASGGGLLSRLETAKISLPAPAAPNVTIGDLNVTIQGNVDEKAIAQIRRELEQYKRNILATVKEATRQKGRVSLA